MPSQGYLNISCGFFARTLYLCEQVGLIQTRERKSGWREGQSQWFRALGHELRQDGEETRRT